jgi:hypothetical protein
MAACHDLIDRPLVLDQAFKDVVEHRVRRQRVLIGLVGFEFGRGRLGDDTLGHHPTGRPERSVRQMLIAPARQCEDRGLVNILEHGVAAAHIPVKRRIADRHFGFVAGREHHPAEFIRQRHQRDAAGAGLQIFLGDVGRPAREGLGEHAAKTRDRRLDADLAQFDADKPGRLGRVIKAILRGVARRHHDAMDLVGAESIGRHRRTERRIDTP